MAQYWKQSLDIWSHWTGEYLSWILNIPTIHFSLVGLTKVICHMNLTTQLSRRFDTQNVTVSSSKRTTLLPRVNNEFMCIKRF